MRSERLANLTLVRPHKSPSGGTSEAPVVACEQVTDQLPGILDGGQEARPAVVAHVEHCLRCQAEMAQYRRLLRALHQLRVVGVEPPVSLLSEVLAQLGDAAERGAIRSALAGRRVAYVAALAVAASAAGAAGVAVVLATRGRASAGVTAARAGAKMPLAS
ncbi:MAG: anti-sigma factor family protein [Acidimicrobiales bacterium]